jgi:hypothetical protein
MFRRRPGKPGGDDASLSSRRSLVTDSAWSAQDRLRSGARRTAKSAGDGVGRATFPLRRRLLWPLQDRFDQLDAPKRALAGGAAVLLVAGAVAGGALVAAPEDSSQTDGARVAVAPAPKLEVKAAKREPAEPTLQGAAPVFEPAPEPRGASEVDPAKAVAKSAPAETADEEVEAEAESSEAAASSSAANAGADSPDGRPAGPEALAVAEDFSDAFVVYETGGLDGKVRRAFGATATPQLSRALLQRPPRLPANMKVPQAKVLNVVAGPSHEGIYSVSVSLLRVGTTSELRLDMEKLKGKDWRVTNVLG